MTALLPFAHDISVPHLENLPGPVGDAAGAVTIVAFALLTVLVLGGLMWVKKRSEDE
ncbi:MAG: hypothetical protein H0V29_11845 [Thermoleophilaceae bacterium]|nr:hypothetical protein [Thermoleophilaceae bacterium]